MTARWVSLLLGLILVGALALLLLLSSPLAAGVRGGSLTGTWVQEGATCPSAQSSCLDTLYLQEDGRYRYNLFHSVETGRWWIKRPGVMQWDGELRGYGFHRVRLEVSYVVEGDTLELDPDFSAGPTRLYRVG